MMMFNLCSATVLLTIVKCATATIQFTIATDACPRGKGVFESCDETARYAMCGSASDYDGQWCCEPEREVCYAWGQQCTGGDSEDQAGTGQILCTNGQTRWCCNNQYEVCVSSQAKINLCETNFKNPYSDVSFAQASSMKVAFLATTKTSFSRTFSTVSSATQETTRSLSANEAGTTSSNTATSLATTNILGAAGSTSSSTPVPPQSQSGGLSSGAIAGIVIGAVVLLVLVGGGAFWMGKRNKSMAVVAPGAYEPYQGQGEQSHTPYHGGSTEDEQGGNGNGNIWGGSVQSYADAQAKAELSPEQRRIELQ